LHGSETEQSRQSTRAASFVIIVTWNSPKMGVLLLGRFITRNAFDVMVARRDWTANSFQRKNMLIVQSVLSRHKSSVVCVNKRLLETVLSTIILTIIQDA